MRKQMILLSAAALLVSLSTTAMAQPTAKGLAKPRSEASLECSKQADAKGLKGKPRKKFRRKCMKDFKKAA